MVHLARLGTCSFAGALTTRVSRLLLTVVVWVGSMAARRQTRESERAVVLLHVDRHECVSSGARRGCWLVCWRKLSTRIGEVNPLLHWVALQGAGVAWVCGSEPYHSYSVVVRGTLLQLSLRVGRRSAVLMLYPPVTAVRCDVMAAGRERGWGRVEGGKRGP